MNISKTYELAIGRPANEVEEIYIKIQKGRYINTLERGSKYRIEESSLLRHLLETGQNTNEDMVALAERGIVLTVSYASIRIYDTFFAPQPGRWSNSISLSARESGWTWFLDTIALPSKNDIKMFQEVKDLPYELTFDHMMKKLQEGVSQEDLEEAKEKFLEEVEPHHIYL